VSEQFLNNTSAHERPFSALKVLSRNSYVEEMRKAKNRLYNKL